MPFINLQHSKLYKFITGIKYIYCSFSFTGRGFRSFLASIGQFHSNIADSSLKSCFLEPPISLVLSCFYQLVWFLSWRCGNREPCQYTVQTEKFSLLLCFYFIIPSGFSFKIEGIAESANLFEYMRDSSNSHETLETEIYRNKWRRRWKGSTHNQRIKSQIEKRKGGVRLLEDTMLIGSRQKRFFQDSLE